MSGKGCPITGLTGEAEMPSRRRLLLGAGALSGALVLGGAVKADTGTKPLATDTMAGFHLVL